MTKTELLANFIREADAAIAALGHTYKLDIPPALSEDWAYWAKSRTAAVLDHLIGWRRLEEDRSKLPLWDAAVSVLCRLWLALAEKDEVPARG